MTIADLLARVGPVLPGGFTAAGANDLSGLVAGLTHDSRQVRKDFVFVALKGARAEGTAFAAQAIAAGASAIVADGAPPSPVPVPWLVVEDARLALALLADEFHGQPSRSMQVVGITGTNGKTTVGYVIHGLFTAAGIPCGLLGTVTYRIGDRDIEASRTTPEASDLQPMLRQMTDAGCGACVMEVSSHALALRRVDGIRFAAGVFTNLTRDHLDFHSGMDAYFAAKRRLFEMLPRDAPAVINLDDPRGASLVETAGRPVTYAINRAADVTPGPLSYTLEGLSFEARTPEGRIRVRSHLVGRPNVHNLLAAIATGLSLGLSLDSIERGIAGLTGVPGRFEVVSTADDDVTVVIDYAHTDDALRNLLETARPLAPRGLITVFGCGGDRDRTKRPLMGMVAARMSDVVIVTSDNPRSEEPQAIIDEVLRGIPGAAATSDRGTPRQTLTEVDRRKAIARAIAGAEAGDLVLIAGKGHERYQEIGGRVLPFDDGEVARAALAERRGRVQGRGV